MIIKCLLVFVFGCVVRVSANCIFSLQKDFGNPSPVLLRNGLFLTPTHQGDVRLRRDESILVGCPGNRQSVLLGNYSTELSDLEVHCVTNKTVRYGARWTGHFKDIYCKTLPWFTTEDIGKCYGLRRNYRVGYSVRDEFYSLYEACFDENLLSTLYVKHNVSPASKFTQIGSRFNFIEGTLYGKTRMSQLYKVTSQKSRFSSLLGDEISQKHLTKNQFLTRGHLAPRADFVMRAQQRASFHYVNSAPQWRRGNAGDWAALEDAIRRRVHSGNRTLTVYTGTHGVLNLLNAENVPVSMYLTNDDNNNNIVPVPFYFFKLIYDPLIKAATAFIMINSPYINDKMISNVSFCNDVCEMNPYFSWLRWRSDDGTHSFCCTYEQFIKEVDHLPPLDVKGLFY